MYGQMQRSKVGLEPQTPMYVSSKFKLVVLAMKLDEILSLSEPLPPHNSRGGWKIMLQYIVFCWIYPIVIVNY